MLRLEVAFRTVLSVGSWSADQVCVTSSKFLPTETSHQHSHFYRLKSKVWHSGVCLQMHSMRTEVGGSGVEGPSPLHNAFQDKCVAKLVYLRCYLKTKSHMNFIEFQLYTLNNFYSYVN